MLKSWLTTWGKMSYKVERIASVEPLVLGEGPHWDERQQALFFVSIHEKTIHKYVPDTGVHTKATLDGRPGFIIPVEGTSDQFVVGVEHKFIVIQWDGEDGSQARVLRELGEIDHHEPKNRINDGKADPRGRLFGGTMGSINPSGTFQKEQGSLYRIDMSRDGTIHTSRLADKIGISNGLAWDLNEKAFYYTDSLEFKVRRYDYDVETGYISNPKYIFNVHEHEIQGFPDGCTIDSDGNLWIAMYDASFVAKVDPRTGTLLQKIPIPARLVTSLTFGGPNHDVLFVTSASIDLKGTKLPPPSGAIFMVTGLGVKSYPNVNFKI